jgi:zinc protease
MTKRICLLLLLVLAALPSLADTNVTRATLKNGLRVIIVRDSLAPVVTVYENYLAGQDESFAGFPGMAHAQEHMAFRGCTGLSGDQIAAIFAQLGGDNDADTQQNITQYFETIPAQDLDVALHVDAGCMRKITDSEAQWKQERGAIEQEVARDLSSPVYNLISRLNLDLFAGTPYRQDALGTKPSFDRMTGSRLQQFQNHWYAPNNAILVIAGDVNPATTLAQIKKLYGDIPSRRLPDHPRIELQPIKPESFTLPSDLPYVITTVAFRMPGTDSPDYAATRILADVLASQRGDIYGLVPAGKALDAGFELPEAYHKASMGMAYAVLPTNANSAQIDVELRRLIQESSTTGVSAALVDAAKRSEVASAEFQRASIPGLASAWSQAVASEGRLSPQSLVDAIKKVTVADVDRVAKQYLVDRIAVVGTLQPQAFGKAVAAGGVGGKEKTVEKVTSTPTKPVALPEWAEKDLKKLEVPSWNLQPSDTKLPNGIRLIVQRDTTTPTVTVMGEIRHDSDLEAPAGEDGVGTVLSGLFPYGTAKLDRVAFQKALDDIAARESAGASFSLQVLSKYFDRGVQLLAENELQPGLPAPAFKVVQQQTAQSVADLLKSPDFYAEMAELKGLLPKNDPDLRHATPQTVSSLTLNDVHHYYEKTFRPDLTTIVVIGDVTPQEARNTIQKYFGDWKAQGPKPPVNLPPVPPNKAASSHVPDPTRVQDSVRLAEELPMTRFNSDYYALEVGNHVLGGGFYATRLYRDLREKTGYVYYVSNQLDANKTRTTFSIDYGSDPSNTDKAHALVIRDLEQMQTSQVSPSDLEQAKALLLRRIPLGEASEESVAGGLLARAVIGLPLDEPVRAAQRYDAMNAEQVRQAFAKWIRPDDLVEVVRGPLPKQ